MDYINQVYGGLHPRTRNPKLHGGQSYIKALMECAQKLPITIRTNSRVVDIIREAPPVAEGRLEVPKCSSLGSNNPHNFALAE